MRFFRALLPSVAFCAFCAFGQTSSSVSSGPGGYMGTVQFAAPAPYILRMVVTGSPYSAEQVSEQLQILADGTRITGNQPLTKVYRDSFGRTRTERPLFRGMTLGGNAPEPLLSIEITDPVAQVRYMLDPTNKIAHRQKLPAQQNMAARTAAPSGGAAPTGSGGVAGGGTGVSHTAGPMGGAAPSPLPAPATVTPLPGEAAVMRPQITREKLGTQTIEGVLAEGTRNTITWPAGSQGNDRPISVLTETWISPDLKVTILTRSTDPRSGEHTQKLTNISRAEPSASLFQPPADYSVVDENGAFSIKLGSQ